MNEELKVTIEYDNYRVAKISVDDSLFISVRRLFRFGNFTVWLVFRDTGKETSVP